MSADVIIDNITNSDGPDQVQIRALLLYFNGQLNELRTALSLPTVADEDALTGVTDLIESAILFPEG